MKIGPRYKKARYLGAAIFRKTQTQKYAIRAQRKTKNKKSQGAKSEYGKQMLEKQKARFSYGVSGRQFARYVRMALKDKGDNAKNLLQILESRLDNVINRAGFAISRSAARQMVSHGHFCVNDTIVTIPSYQVRVGDIITIRPGSINKSVFKNLNEELKNIKLPTWIKIDFNKKDITIAGIPTINNEETLFDVSSVLQFYTR